MKTLLLLLTLISWTVQGTDFTKASKIASQSVVMIRTFQGDSDEVAYRRGSGVVVKRGGYIITNYHVIEGSCIVTVIYKKDTLEAYIVSVNHTLDVALLKVNKNLPVIARANSDSVEVGEEVLTAGYPLLHGLVVNSGIVGAKFTRIDLFDDSFSADYILTDAVINPGNSGGPLLNSSGQLIGINTIMISYTGYYMGYSVAISSNDIYKFIKKSLKNRKSH